MRIRLMALLLCAVAGVTGCGLGASNGSHGTTQTVASGATLACTFHEMPVQADLTMVRMGVACTVTGVAAINTSFSVQHRVTEPNGQGTAVDATCSGPVKDGMGVCSVVVIVQQSATEPGTLAGELLPSGATLSPVTPGIVP